MHELGGENQAQSLPFSQNRLPLDLGLVVMGEVSRRLQEVSPTTAAIALEVPPGEGFFSSLPSFLHRWLPILNHL